MQTALQSDWKSDIFKILPRYLNTVCSIH